jgi:hypothetical protein
MCVCVCVYVWVGVRARVCKPKYIYVYIYIYIYTYIYIYSKTLIRYTHHINVKCYAWHQRTRRASKEASRAAASANRNFKNTDFVDLII